VTIEAESQRAPAKINLFLHVGARRPDGYHALQSLVAFVEAGDRLTFSPARELSLTVEGPFGAGLSADGDNLVVRAAKDLDSGKGARIVLTKNLPVASGIGGGSADAAAALRGLARLWGLNLAQDEMLAIAAGLGSDVPVCVSSEAQWMEGRGEKLTTIDPLPAIPILLVNPGVSVSTPEVFAALGGRSGTELPLPPKFNTSDDLIGYLRDTRNDLEAPARAIAPVIGDVLALLSVQPGARPARMSGSGATCFALFDTDGAAIAAAGAIRAHHASWWTFPTRIARFSSAASLSLADERVHRTRDRH